MARHARLLLAIALALAVSAADAVAQRVPDTAPAAEKPAQPAAAKDPLGRDTPRQTVLGFLEAGRSNEDQLAAQFLDTELTGQRAALLAHQLFIVLDARLPARLAQITDVPEGSRSNPLRPNQEVIGTIESGSGVVEIVLNRMNGDSGTPIWLFSRGTLGSIPALYQEVTQRQSDRPLSRFLSERIGRNRVLESLSVLLGLAAFYGLTLVLNRLLSGLLGRVWPGAFKTAKSAGRNVLPLPARLLVMALLGRWVLANLSLSLFVRQFWTNVARSVTIATVVWLLIHLNGEIEQWVIRRFPPAQAGATSLLRLIRRAADVLVIFLGLLAFLHLFAIDATPALAGLGVGGIAVALAAQKTLENVVAGASLIFDKAVRVGDTLRIGTTVGTVDHIGLRSTWIRTLDRTMISIPNSQIANASVETLSVRDKFWFHPAVGLVYETTPSQLRVVLDGIRKMLDEHPRIDRQSVRVRFLNLGAFSLDVDVFAYVFARDWNHFLEIQEEFLFGITDIVAKAGTQIAFPSQTMYVAGSQPALAADALSSKR
jgi:MscS family membrane protein